MAKEWKKSTSQEEDKASIYSRKLIHKGSHCSADDGIMVLSAEGRELSCSIRPRLCTTQGIFKQDLMVDMSATM